MEKEIVNQDQEAESQEGQTHGEIYQDTQKSNWQKLKAKIKY